MSIFAVNFKRKGLGCSVMTLKDFKGTNLMSRDCMIESISLS